MTERAVVLAVIGAGPAGLAAALAAAARGVRVVLVDSAPGAGGQYYRQPADALGARRPQALHHQWRTWERLREGLTAHVDAGRITHLSDHQVWCVERLSAGFEVHALVGTRQEDSVAVRTDGVLLATGAYEKVLPFPGWTLPGVVTAGGAQAMLKGGLVLPGRKAVVAGTGPLLLPVATGLAAAGAQVVGLVESADPRDFARRARALGGRPAKLVEAAGYAVRLMSRRVPVMARHVVLEAHGPDRLEAVTVARLDAAGRAVTGSERRLPCDTLAVGHGLLPHSDLAEGLGCRLDGPNVHVDDEQRTDVPGIWAAGEATGVGGAALSLAEGHLAGRSAAARLLGAAPDLRGRAAPVRARARQRSFAAELDGAYAAPVRWEELVTDATVVCRCEEVTAGEVRDAVGSLGAGDLRTVKLLTRAGMGWCQGRVCEPGVAGVAGCELVPAKRSLARPVPLGALAAPPPGAVPPEGPAPPPG
ncbi:NAD(P)/FAD-dependent oxidoreductase [Streptomyces sp. NPDC006172]|uniref:NAD(P)/FAD-dependent oxidoreductase n=1 Tax=Streptomyces sp. NPDC006172 TaxID=3154470 RepID=UPI0033E10C1F